MPSCRYCGASIEFRRHPASQKLMPFNADGELHFATCLLKNKAKTEYRSASEILCKTCEELPLFIFIQPTAAGDRLGVMCDNLHHFYLPMTEKNRELVNATYEQAKTIKAIRYARSPVWRDALVSEYVARFPVTEDVERHLK